MSKVHYSIKDTDPVKLNVLARNVYRRIACIPKGETAVLNIQLGNRMVSFDVIGGRWNYKLCVEWLKQHPAQLLIEHNPNPDLSTVSLPKDAEDRTPPVIESAPALILPEAPIEKTPKKRKAKDDDNQA